MIGGESDMLELICIELGRIRAPANKPNNAMKYKKGKSGNIS
ncbi:MAG: hypothetical protein ACFFAI_16835 [Promethearchaeota archaeon]